MGVCAERVRCAMVSRRDALPGVSGGTKVVQLVILDFMEAVTGWLELRRFKACAMVWWSRVSVGLHADAATCVLGGEVGVVGSDLVSAAGKRARGEILLGDARPTMATYWVPLSC